MSDVFLSQSLQDPLLHMIIKERSPLWSGIPLPCHRCCDVTCEREVVKYLEYLKRWSEWTNIKFDDVFDTNLFGGNISSPVGEQTIAPDSINHLWCRKARDLREWRGVQDAAPSAFFKGANSSWRGTSKTKNRLNVPISSNAILSTCKTYLANLKTSKTNFSILIPLGTDGRTISPEVDTNGIFFLAMCKGRSAACLQTSIKKSMLK